MLAARCLRTAVAIGMAVVSQTGANPFKMPPLRSARTIVPAGCDAVRERVTKILPEVEREIPVAMQQAMRQVASPEAGESAPDGWDRAAALSALNSDPATGLWAELSALQIEWRTEFVADAGIFLTLLKHDEAAGVFLRCAYDAGSRSPFLLEALANLHRRTGDLAQAREAINAALAAAPDDPIIQTEAALFNTGSPPPPPPPPGADALARAFAALDRHRQRVVAAGRSAVDLQIRVDAAIGAGGADTARQQREGYEQAAQGWAQTLDAIRQMLPMARKNPTVRNTVMHTIVMQYLALTEQLLTTTGSATIWENWDVDFWGETLGFEPLELARLMGQLSRFQYGETRSSNLANSIADFATVEFEVLFHDSQRVRTIRKGECTRLIGGAAEACRLEVDRQWCGAVRPLFAEWVAKSEGWFQRAARRFDRVAAGRIAAGGWAAEDAWEFAAAYAKEIKSAPGSDVAGLVREINEKFRSIVDLAAGSQRSGPNNGPSAQARYSAETYRLDKQSFEANQASYRQTIRDVCDEVDRKVMEQLLEEHQQAVRSMLLDRLLNDFNAEYSPKLNCSFSAGKWFSASIDDTGKVGIGGKWKWLDKSVPDAEGGGSTEVGRSYKASFQDGEFVGASASVDGGARMGPFSGKGGMTLGTTWNSGTNQWDTSVEFSGTLGVGLKAGNYGVTCYPGSVKIKFDPRVVAADAVAYVNALNGK